MAQKQLLARYYTMRVYSRTVERGKRREASAAPPATAFLVWSGVQMDADGRHMARKGH